MSGPTWKMPAPSSPMAPTSRSTSDHSAIRLATGVSSGVTCVVERELEKPIAPARIASRTAAVERREVVLGGRLGERALAHDVHAQGGMADIGAVVDGLGEAVDGGEVLGEGLPRPVDAGEHRLGRDVLDRGQAAGEPLALLGPARRQREAAVAHDHGGDPVPAGAAADRVPRHLGVHVGVAVDEARGDDQAVGVDHPLGPRPDPPDLDDAPVLRPPRRPRSVPRRSRRRSYRCESRDRDPWCPSSAWYGRYGTITRSVVTTRGLYQQPCRTG